MPTAGRKHEIATTRLTRASDLTVVAHTSGKLRNRSGPLRIGVIGTGIMGAHHVRMLSRDVPGAWVTTVFDMDLERASRVAGQSGADTASSAEELIHDSDVDAVVVASPDSTHEPLIMECLAAGKHVLCEKPLGKTGHEASQIVKAEMSSSRGPLIQVGFMRRYDPAHVKMRDLISGGALGSVRVLHAVHRNVQNTTSVDDSSLITGSMIHEFDTISWLLADPLVAVRVESPVAEGFRDLQVATLWTAGGAIAVVEVSVNARYGYDVRCEVVGSRATATLDSAAPIEVRARGWAGREVGDSFTSHFAVAYRIELSAWVHAVLRGSPVSPNAWDGLAANLAADAAIRSLKEGDRIEIEQPVRPDAYG